MAVVPRSVSKYRITRRGKKLQGSDDQRTILALPKEVPERIWTEIFLKEEVDLLIFDIREEIVDAAIEEYYDKYMERQCSIFTAHCAAQAWMKLINWHFYRHDPGEEPTNYPPCWIPHSRDSWVPDEVPDTSPKDTWAQHDLTVMEDCNDESHAKRPRSFTSLKYPLVDDIPHEFWFPGKVQLSDEIRTMLQLDAEVSLDSSGTVESRSEEKIGTESEVLQKVTDYSIEELSKGSTLSALKNTTPVDGSLHGAGDSTVVRVKGRKTDKIKLQSATLPQKDLVPSSRGSKILPPLDSHDSRSRISMISDCRLRNLRLDTQFEISSEIMDSVGEIVKRK